MSAANIVEIRCNGRSAGAPCPERRQYTTPHIAVARTRARKLGWLAVVLGDKRHRDYCPVCAPTAVFS